jgi:hypothetical protein
MAVFLKPTAFLNLSQQLLADVLGVVVAVGVVRRGGHV